MKNHNRALRNIRSPFIIADENGRILFSSPPSTDGSENFFTDGMISSSDRSFTLERLSARSFSELIGLKSARDGKLMLISPGIFPYARIISVVMTDINYDEALPVLSHSFSNVVTLHSFGTLTKNSEAIYRLIVDAVRIANLFSVPFSFISETYSDIFGDIERMSFLCGCTCSLSSDIPIKFKAENFDDGLFKVFLIVVFGEASRLSPERHCSIDLNLENGKVKIKASFSTDCEKPRDILRQNALFNYLHLLCDRNNIPFSAIACAGFRFEIIPKRPEVSLLGIKAPPAELEY